MTEDTSPIEETGDADDPKRLVVRTWPKAPASVDGQAIGHVRDMVEHYQTPRLISMKGVDGRDDALIAALPSGLTLHPMQPYLDAQRDTPKRRTGKTIVTRVQSFIDHAMRFMDDDSTLFAETSRTTPKLTAVLDYHRKTADGEPRFGAHRTVYECPLSDEWKAWNKQNSESMTQDEFAEFLEDRIGDVALPPLERPKEDGHVDAAIFDIADQLRGTYADPARLMDLSRFFKVFAQERVEQSTNLSSGEVELVFSQEHTDGQGNKLNVPNLFLIAIPVFQLGEVFRMVVRLRYRKSGGGVRFAYDLYQPDATFEAAFEAVCNEAVRATGLPLIYGVPETNAVRPT